MYYGNYLKKLKKKKKKRNSWLFYNVVGIGGSNAKWSKCKGEGQILNDFSERFWYALEPRFQEKDMSKSLRKLLRVTPGEFFRNAMAA